MSEDKQPNRKFEPKFAGYAHMGTHSTKRSGLKHGLWSSSDVAGNLKNLKDGVSPFNYENGDVDVQDAIILSRKAYWNVSIYKLTIDIMTEFANSDIHFIGQNKNSVEFFNTWYKKINGWNLADQFFRELFRSSNVFMMRVKGNVKSRNKGVAKIPLRYLMLDPSEIRCSSAASFVDGSYKKVINEFEASVLKQSKDPKHIKFKQSLPPEAREAIDKGRSVSIPLSSDDLVSTFFKKQDYEGLAVPMYFPVLFDINLKLEFKKAEQIIARACEYMILLITVGDKDVGVDQDLVNHIETLFSTESVGRVLVSDWTTKMNFVMPELEKILGPAKYEAVNKDISNGLMNMFFGDNKYADSMAKIKIFLERLKESRKIFLNEFLKPEMEKICEEMGFRECPEPRFENVDLKDEVEYMKIYNRLAELGFLTDEETMNAHKTHMLPEKFDSIISQEQFKEEKEKGLYQPIGTGSDEAVSQPAGRPNGTPQKQKDKKVTPVGEGSFSAERIKDTVGEMNKLYSESAKLYKNIFNIQRMSKRHKANAKNIANQVVTGEEMENWSQKLSDYLNGDMPADKVMDGVMDLADEHKVDLVAAAILYHSQKTEE